MRKPELITAITAYTHEGAWNKVRELFATEYEYDEELSTRLGPNIYQMHAGNKHGLIFDRNESLEINYVEEQDGNSYSCLCTIWIATEGAIEMKIAELERKIEQYDSRLGSVLEERNKLRDENDSLKARIAELEVSH